MDSLILRRASEVYVLKHGVTLDSIKQMSEDEMMEYIIILGAFDEIEKDHMEKK
jgi:hypothetical protein